MDKRFTYFPGRAQEGIQLSTKKDISLIIQKGKTYKEIDDIKFELSVPPASEIKFSLVNVVGKVVFQIREYCHEGLCRIKLSKKELKKGLYYLEVIAGENFLVRRIAIE